MEFPTTRWDELAQASLHGDASAQAALDQFCRRYWQPVNAFLRWKGYSADDAADLTQDFFLNFLETRSWRRADPLKGSFRTFLLGALVHRILKAHAHDARLKRGGGEQIVSLEEVENEPDSTDLPSIAPAAAAQFDRAWAMQMLAAAMTRTRHLYETSGKQALFEGLKSFLGVKSQPESYEQTAMRLGVSPTIVKNEIHRLRQAFRLALRMEISQTVSAPHEVDAELRHLRTVLARQGLDSASTDET